MEGRGFLLGVHINAPVLGCVIRGISDLLSGKNEADHSGSQDLASGACSAVAFEMLATLPDTTLPSNETVASEVFAYFENLRSANQAAKILGTDVIDGPEASPAGVFLRVSGTENGVEKDSAPISNSNGETQTSCKT
jgi:hypothetical protein